MPSRPYVGLPPGLRTRRRRDDPHDDRRAGRQRGLAARGRARVPRRRRRPRRVHGAHALGLLDRGPADAGHPARRGGRRAGRRRRRVRRAHPGAGGRRAPAARHRLYNCAVVLHRGRVLGVVPKSYLPNYREFYEPPSLRRRRRPGRHPCGCPARTSRSGPTWCSRPPTSTASRCTSRSARTCGCRSRPAPRRARRGDRAGEPLGQPHHGRARRGPPAPRPFGARTVLGGLRLRRGGRRGVHHRPLVGRPDHASTRTATCSPSPSASRPASATPSPTSTSTAALRSGCGWARSTTTPPPRADGARRSAPSSSLSTRRPATSGLRRRRPLPVRADRPRPPRARLLRGLQHPGRPGSCSGCGRSETPRSSSASPGGSTPPTRSSWRPARWTGSACPRRTSSASRCPASRRASARSPTRSASGGARGHVREIDIPEAARQMLRDLGHPFARGEPVYDVTFENVQAGLRTDYLFRAANQRGGIVSAPATSPRLALGWSTYGVGDQMSHYTRQHRRPQDPVQHLIRWVICSGQFDEEVDEALPEVLDTEISPELVPADATSGSSRASRRSARTTCRTSPSTRCCATASGPADRVPRRARLVGSGRRLLAGGFPGRRPGGLRPRRDPAAGSRCSPSASSATQFKRSAIPNGPKVVAGGSLSPRGDWRVPSDASATTGSTRSRRTCLSHQ